MPLQNSQIVIVHEFTSPLNEITEITLRNHAEYAIKHGYLLQEWEKKPKTSVGSKLCALYDIFQQDADIRRAFWIDSDAVFTNLELTLTEHLPDGKVVMAYDIFGPSADCLWLENCAEVRRLLWAASQVGEWIFEGNHPGTAAFNETMGLRYLSLHPPYQELFAYIEPKVMKSHYSEYCTDGRPQDSFGAWQKGDFILSLSNIAEPFKLAVLEKVLLPE